MGDLLRRFLPPYRARAALGVGAKTVEVVFDLLTPIIVARMIDEGVARHDADTTLRLGLLLVALAVVGYCFTLVCQWQASKVSQRLGTDVRAALFAKVNELSGAELDDLGTSTLVTRVTSDVNQVQVAVALGIRQLVRWPLLAVGSIVCALIIDLGMGAVFAVCVPLVGLVFWQVMRRSIPLFREVQARLDALSRITREILSGVRVIRAFRREAAEQARFVTEADGHLEASNTVGTLSATLNPSTFLVMNLGVAAVLWIGGIRVNVGDLTQGQVVAFVNYMTQTLLAIVYVANLVVTFTRGAASAARVMEVLALEPSVRDGATRPARRPKGTAALRLEGVSFSYAEGAADALHDVSLALEPGQRLGVIGGTGSGKSTLASLLVRLYDPREGRIRLFGYDLADYPLTQLHELVSIVPQSASLISGTIRDNLLWRDAAASDDELWAALELAQAADFVRDKELGLDMRVEAGGRNLSGGQRQRLTIARALVGDPYVLVLDDAASALDMATDARLREALGSLDGITTVTISQRVSSVMGCDLICVLRHGAVAGLGTHEELMRGCELYREIAGTQLHGREVQG